MMIKQSINFVNRSSSKYFKNSFHLSASTKCCSSHNTSKPVKVLVTGAAGQIGYSILPRLARGDAFGKDRPIILKMLDLEVTKNIMEGVRMELEDCSFQPLVRVEVHTEPEKAYGDTDVVVMLANMMDLKSNMTRAQLLKENLRVYKEIIEILKSHSNKDLKILMIANPANTNCLLLIEHLKGIIPAQNLTSLSRLDHNRTRTMLATKLGVTNEEIRKVIVWGNHSSTMYPDVRFAEVKTPSGWKKITDVIQDKDWIHEFLVPVVRERAFAVIKARGKSSALSASSAGIDHLRNWLVGTDHDDWVSMGVYSDSTYEEIPHGLVYSSPCTCKDGHYQVVKGLKPDHHTAEMMRKTAEELIGERDLVMK